MQILKKFVNAMFLRAGYSIVNISRNRAYFDEKFMPIYDKVRRMTLLSPPEIYMTFHAVSHIAKNNIEGDIVECGVWRGGASILMAETLKLFDDVSRRVYLFDTFKGMSEPTDYDFVANQNWVAWDRFKRKKRGDYIDWVYSPLEEVTENCRESEYPFEKFVFVEGKVEDTIPDQAPELISVLRLDTDWYESTLHELIHLYPRVVDGGVVIIYDYGRWAGARKAVHEYLDIYASHEFPFLDNFAGGRAYIVKTET